MKTLLLLLLLGCAIPQSWSQQLFLDSLNLLLQNETDPYERIDLHLDPQKGLEFIEEALKKVDASVAHKHVGNLYKNQAIAHSYLGDQAAVFKSYQKALSYFEKVKTDPSIVQ